MSIHRNIRFFGFAAIAALATGAIAVQRSDQRVRVESRDGRQARYRVSIPASARVRLVERLSSQACVQGRSWGYDRQGIWVDDGCRAVFSIDYRNDGRNDDRNNGRYDRYDRNDPRYNEKLDRWRDRVDRERRRRSQDDWNGQWARGWGNTGRIQLGSDSNQRRTFNIGNIRDVRLVQQVSDAPCREGRSWGHTSSTIWVDDGCRAIFEVTRR